MTQRRRLDLHLAEQAVAAGADFRDGVAVTDIEAEADGMSARLGGSPIRASFLVDADGANGVVAKAAGLGARIVRGVALEGNVPWGALEPSPVRGHRLGRARHRARRLRLGLPEGRSREPRSGRVAGRRGRTCARTSTASRGRTGSTRRRSRDVRGHRSAHARAGRAGGARSGAARRRRRRVSSTRCPATGCTRRSCPRVSPRRSSSPGAPETYEPALSAALDRHAAASWKAKRAADRYPRRMFVGAARAGRLRRDLGPARAETSRTRARRPGSRARRFGSSRGSRAM